MESYDLGCSYRGGPDTDSVFTHAGLSFISSGPHSANIHGCESHYSRRARRSVDLRHELVTMKWNLSAELQECCVQGFSPILMKRSCEERQRRVSEMSTLDQCAEVFYNCCLRGEALRKVAAQDNGFSRRFCVAEPYKLTAMKDIFVSLRLPYSVRKYEQMSVMAVIYNYGSATVQLAAHMEQVPGLCSPGSVTLAAFVNVSVAPESSELVTFAAVPMTNGDIPIKIRLYDITKGRETDAVEKSLNIWLPGGCAEQTMKTLAPTVLALRYLDLSQQWVDLPLGTRDQALHNTDIVLSLLAERQSAGVGMRSHRGRDVTSHDISHSVGFLVSVQKDDGSFSDPHPVLYRSLQGGLRGDEEHASMTAFITVALKTSLPFLEEGMRSRAEASINKATTYLLSHVEELERPYAVAITAYCLAVCRPDKGEAEPAWRQLQALSTLDDKGCRMWEAGPKGRPKEETAISVETTAYALLTALAHQDIPWADSASCWLVAQENYGGGFKST
ncbi:hypothetical protein CRUP_009966, partial [Coryphaenoides rupestris]